LRTFLPVVKLLAGRLFLPVLHSSSGSLSFHARAIERLRLASQSLQTETSAYTDKGPSHLHIAIIVSRRHPGKGKMDPARWLRAKHDAHSRLRHPSIIVNHPRRLLPTCGKRGTSPARTAGIHLKPAQSAYKPPCHKGTSPSPPFCLCPNNLPNFFSSRPTPSTLSPRPAPNRWADVVSSGSGRCGMAPSDTRQPWGVAPTSRGSYLTGDCVWYTMNEYACSIRRQGTTEWPIAGCKLVPAEGGIAWHRLWGING